MNDLPGIKDLVLLLKTCDIFITEEVIVKKLGITIAALVILLVLSGCKNGVSDPPGNNKANLSNITFSSPGGGTLTPSFDPNKTKYKLNVPSTGLDYNYMVTVTGEKADENASIAYSPSQEVDLSNGPGITNTKTINITVTADDETVKTYTVEVIREKSTDIPVVAGIGVEYSGGFLFAGNVHGGWQVTVPSTADRVRVSVSALPIDYLLFSDDFAYDPEYVEVTGLEAGGSTTVTITAYAENKDYYKTYTLTVTRAAN
ncbi:cadherin-like beta sandwich domain-containing protein [Treponema sp. OttesenSCG-928-L16]|nr:cadherin-like beta sandwich domain-containing protein [Treponema sp. OttesenSCG-928-L16]